MANGDFRLPDSPLCASLITALRGMSSVSSSSASTLAAGLANSISDFNWGHKMSTLNDHYRSPRRKRNRRSQRHNVERGQMLVLVAFAMVGLAVATGLALDGGMLLLRKAQLNKAVDA